MLVFCIGRQPAAGAGVGFAAGFGVPRWLLSFLKKRRENKFLDNFPDARRRHRARHQGRPAAARLPEDYRDRSAGAGASSEFKSIVETQTIGMPIGEACAKLYERMPLPEANFFGIVISIQQKAGGNLSEALGNLSHVLRDRKKMKAKIQAMSMEAKASAVDHRRAADLRRACSSSSPARTTSNCFGPTDSAASCWPAAPSGWSSACSS